MSYRCVLIGLFDQQLALRLAPRLLLLSVLGFGLAFAARGRATADKPDPLALGNPAELGRALVLGLLLAAILVAARVAQERLGTEGLRVTAISG